MFEQEEIFLNCISRLKKIIDNWNGEKVLLYGAGEHSNAVLKKVSWNTSIFLGFLDRSKKKQQERFFGFHVYAPEKIKETGATKIIISSFSYQEEIYRNLQKIGLEGVEFIKIYNYHDLVAFVKKRYAFCPTKKKVKEGLSQEKDKYILPFNREGSPKILLIHPPFPISNHRHKKILPMNLLYLAGYIRKENPNAIVRIFDGQIQNFSVQDMELLIKKESWDIIGIGYWTAQEPVVSRLSRFIKNETDSFLVHGGVHPTLCPEEAALLCDIVVMNEGEKTFSQIIQSFPDKNSIYKISGTAYQNGHGLTKNLPRPLIQDLDSLPLPAFDLIPDMKLYDSPMHVTGGLRVPLIGSRGCPYTCTFCSSPIIWDRKVRWRSPINIVDEMEKVISLYGITQFHFWDDNIMLDRDHMEELSNEIIKRSLKINWCGLTRASLVIKGKELLPLMKKAGCVGIEIGIESFSDESTELVRKGEGVKEMRDASCFMEEAGIAPLYTHMFFNPGENIRGYIEKQKFIDEVADKNTAYLADSQLGQASTPHRKTLFEKEANKLGEVFLKDHSTYVHQRINFIPHSLLNDVPVKTREEQENPLNFLEIILQAIFDWNEKMIDQYIDINQDVWGKIDGQKSVRRLCEEIEKERKLDNYTSKMFTCLSIVGLAREGSIRSGR